jgi:hypothetical protein
MKINGRKEPSGVEAVAHMDISPHYHTALGYPLTPPPATSTFAEKMDP